jgi:hypothetical protein
MRGGSGAGEAFRVYLAAKAILPPFAPGIRGVPLWNFTQLTGCEQGIASLRRAAGMDRKSEMCLAPNNDQPGDQKNQGEKNRRGHSQPAREPAPVNLRKIAYWIDMRRVSSTETIYCQDSGDDTAIN